ncbi:hypothetical protein H2O64_05325 [Kordia sp. YSTF-M3]|uniref:Bacteriocin n=1 Tax=Kordia aestuariivivens TaxID=2759037 RepID=A0ABR7Q678_9FLAO|nr:hypothetical protein [Kordia aestuariivivens]MBC8754081.1 hypothetical protein [Kordia aestuariivivens]
MKKKKLKTLRLNKSAISVFDSILGGRADCSDGGTCNDKPIEPANNSDIMDCYTQQDASWCWE